MFPDHEDEEFERLSLEFEPAVFAAELKFAAMKAEVAEAIDVNGHRFPRGRLKYSIGANNQAHFAFSSHL
jgi:hypothetical protein